MNPEKMTAESLHEALERCGGAPAPDAEAFAAISKAAALAAVRCMAAIEISGKDAADYLHRRLAQSVKKLSVGRGVHALQLSGEGRMQCDLLIYRTGEARFTALVDPGFADSAAALLDKYVLMDEVEVAGPSSDSMVLTLLGPRSGEVIAGVLGASPGERLGTEAWSAVADATFGDKPVSIYRDDRGSTVRHHVVVAGAVGVPLAAALRERLQAIGGAAAGPSALEYARIAAGVTRFGADTNEGTLPLEVNLRDAVDLNKGCFPGQEFLARINNLGHPAHVLARLRYDAAGSPSSGDAVRDAAGEIEGEGRITSAQTIEGLAEGLALAVLPWKLRGLRQALVLSGGGSFNAAVELLGEYPDASGARRTI